MVFCGGPSMFLQAPTDEDVKVDPPTFSSAGNQLAGPLKVYLPNSGWLVACTTNRNVMRDTNFPRLVCNSLNYQNAKDIRFGGAGGSISGAVEYLTCNGNICMIYGSNSWYMWSMVYGLMWMIVFFPVFIVFLCAGNTTNLKDYCVTQFTYNVKCSSEKHIQIVCTGISSCLNDWMKPFTLHIHPLHSTSITLFWGDVSTECMQKLSLGIVFV